VVLAPPEPPRILGSQEPTHRTFTPYETTLAPQVIGLAEMVGVELVRVAEGLPRRRPRHDRQRRRNRSADEEVGVVRGRPRAVPAERQVGRLRAAVPRRPVPVPRAGDRLLRAQGRDRGQGLRPDLRPDPPLTRAAPRGQAVLPDQRQGVPRALDRPDPAVPDPHRRRRPRPRRRLRDPRRVPGPGRRRSRRADAGRLGDAQRAALVRRIRRHEEVHDPGPPGPPSQGRSTARQSRQSYHHHRSTLGSPTGAGRSTTTWIPTRRPPGRVSTRRSGTA
jgi:hypothetical protein